MRSRHKLDVVARVMPEFGGKRWVAVTQRNGRTFYPSFEDLFRMVRAIVWCERDKYRGLNRDPADMVRRFFNRMIDLCDGDLSTETYERAWRTLRDEFKIPDRCHLPDMAGPPSTRRPDA